MRQKDLMSRKRKDALIFHVRVWPITVACDSIDLFAEELFKIAGIRRNVARMQPDRRPLCSRVCGDTLDRRSIPVRITDDSDQHNMPPTFPASGEGLDRGD